MTRVTWQLTLACICCGLAAVCISTGVVHQPVATWASFGVISFVSGVLGGAILGAITITLNRATNCFTRNANLRRRQWYRSTGTLLLLFVWTGVMLVTDLISEGVQTSTTMLSVLFVLLAIEFFRYHFYAVATDIPRRVG